MGIRGIIKDILITYLTVAILIAAYKSNKITTSMVIVSVALLVLVAWFLLERIGLIEQM